MDSSVFAQALDTIIAHSNLNVQAVTLHYFSASADVVYKFRTDFSLPSFLAYEPFLYREVVCTPIQENEPQRGKEKRKKCLFLIAPICKVLTII